MGRLAEFSQAEAEQARAAAEQAGKRMAALGDGLRKSLQDRQDRQVKTLNAGAAVGSQGQSDLSRRAPPPNRPASGWRLWATACGRACRIGRTGKSRP